MIRTQLFRIGPSTTIGEVAEIFVRRDIECLIVEMGDGPVKLLSERALLPSASEVYDAGRMPLKVVTQRDLTRSVLLRLRTSVV